MVLSVCFWFFLLSNPWVSCPSHQIEQSFMEICTNFCYSRILLEGVHLFLQLREDRASESWKEVSSSRKTCASEQISGLPWRETSCPWRKDPVPRGDIGPAHLLWDAGCPPGSRWTGGAVVEETNLFHWLPETETIWDIPCRGPLISNPSDSGSPSKTAASSQPMMVIYP